MSHINENNSQIRTVVRQAVSDEPWFKRLGFAERGRCVGEVAAEIASAINGQIDHYRENLGAFDTDPQSAREEFRK